MRDWKLPWNGACLCGRVKLRVTAPPMVTMACHCKGCQKLTSGPYSLSLLLPAAGLEVTGETVLGGLQTVHRHHYCAFCKNWLFTIPEDMDRQFVNLRPTMLDDTSWLTPFVDIAAASKLPGVVSGAKRSFDNFPDMPQFMSLIQEFAEANAS